MCQGNEEVDRVNELIKITNKTREELKDEIYLLTQQTNSWKCLKALLKHKGNTENAKNELMEKLIKPSTCILVSSTGISGPHWKIHLKANLKNLISPFSSNVIRFLLVTGSHCFGETI